MTISSTTRKAGPYSGTGAQTAFPFAFKVLASTDVLVVQTDSTGVEHALTLGTNYSVALNANQDAAPGGTVTLPSALPSGQLLTLSSAVPLTQGTSIPNMGGFYPKVIEQALDKLTIVGQQLADAAGRCIRFAISDTNPSGALPTTAVRAGKFMAFDATGNPTAATGTGADAALRTDLASPTAGSALVAFVQRGLGAVAQSMQDALRLGEVNVEGFGAKGDGVADDWTAIMACFTAMKSRGRNVTVRMSQRYMISKGLKLPSHVRIKGPMSARYPYNNAAPAPALIANFTDPNQWVIEPETTSGGAAVPYNTLLTGLPDGATYNCAVEDLLIASVGVTPYGAIRMHGCPGSSVSNVSTLGTGIGLLVNECYGGDYVLHGEALYYGTIMWGEANANRLDAYYDQAMPRVKTVPAGYLFPGISALNGTFVAALKLSTEAHYNRPFGAVVGSTTSTSSNDDIAVTVEGFSGGLFLNNARSVTAPRFYVEGATNEVDFAIVAANSSMASMGVHAYLSGGGTLIDPGANLYGDLTLDGVISYATLKPAKLVNTSRLIIRGVSMAGAAQTVPEPNVIFPDDPGNWIAPPLLNGWTNAGGVNAPVGYRINPLTWKTEVRGVPIGGLENQPVFILPAGYRSTYKGACPVVITSAAAPIGSLVYLATGEVIPATAGMSANGLDLSPLTFRAEQ